MHNPMFRILLVEDDLHLGFLLSEYLKAEGFLVSLCRTGRKGLEAFLNDTYDVCILDVTLPQMDGFELARYMRAEKPEVPFLFLTARTLKMDVLKGYSVGAEDYITKPFDEDELRCRIDVILRRSSDKEVGLEALEHFTVGSYQFDAEKQELTYMDLSWRLTETESKVLHLLCLSGNKLLKRDDAVEQIYGKRDYFLGRSFDVFISKLRKLLRYDERVSIENVFGKGFILKMPEEVEKL